MRKIVVAISSATVASALATSRRGDRVGVRRSASPARPRRARARARRVPRRGAPSSRAARPRSCRTRRSGAARPAAPRRARRGCGPAPRASRARRRSPPPRRAGAEAQLGARQAARRPRSGPSAISRERRGSRSASPPRGACRTGARAPPRTGRRARAATPTSISPGQVDGDAPVLAAVAHVGDALPLDRRRRRRSLAQRLAHLSVERRSASRSRSRALDPAEAHVVELGAREQQAAAEKSPASGGTIAVRRRARPPAPRRAPGRSRRRPSARSRTGRAPSRSRPPAARASSSRSRARGCRGPPRAVETAEPPRRAQRRLLGELARDREVARRRAARSGCSRERRSRR